MKKILSIGLVFLITLLMFQTFPTTIGSMDTWYSTTPIPAPHYIHGSVVHDSRIYLVGGKADDGEPGSARAHVYYASVQPDGYIDPAGWTLTTSLPDARNFGQNNVLVYKDRIYVLGGRANYPPQRIERATVWFAAFNPDGTIGNWNTTTSLPYPVGDIAAVVWNDRIYILGGWDGFGWHNYVYYAEISSDGSLGSWQQSALLPAGAPRIHDHVAAVHNGVIYLFGGEYPLTHFPKEVYYATIDSSGEVGEWNETTQFPVRLQGHSALVHGDNLFVIGGGYQGTYYGTVYKAHINPDGSLGSWLEWGSLPHRLVQHSSVVLNERAYVIGGQLENKSRVDTVYFTSMHAPLGMVSYWRLNECSGTTAYDSVGDNDGTLVDGPEWTTGIVDGGLSFDGIDDYVEVSHHPDLNIGGNGKGFTAEAWIKTPTPMHTQQIVRKGFGGVQYEFKTWDYGRLLRLIVYPYGTSYHVDVDATIAADDGNWHHVAATKSASDSLLRIYFDGELVGTSTSPCPGTEASTAPFWMGTELGPDYWFKGTIDEVAIHNRALALEEIQQHYENGLMGLDYFGEPGMNACKARAIVDINPDTLNLKSNGEWITAYIELPAGHNLSNVDISTVQINNTISVDSSAPTQIGDYDLDGVPDLMVKFERASIIEWLGAIDYSEETGKSFLTTITIKGKVSGTAFEGSDTIKTLRK